MYRYNHLVWDSPLDKSEKLILLYLLHLANDQGICWPSLSTIGEKTDMTRQGVIKVLDRLRSLGIVEWHVEEDVKRRVYRVYPERLADLDKTKVVNDVDQVVNGVDQVVNGVDQVVNDVDQGGQLGLPAWSTGFTGVVNPVDPTYPIDLSIDLKTTTTTTPLPPLPTRPKAATVVVGEEKPLRLTVSLAKAPSRLSRRPVKTFTNLPLWPLGKRAYRIAFRLRPTPRTGPWPCGRCGKPGCGSDSNPFAASLRIGGPGTNGSTGPWPAIFGAWELRLLSAPWNRPSRAWPRGLT
ncbi:MAG: helix-turn-helix domain-containing protein [Thermus antranikianii]|nr:MAG: helix-turn-helix domain-containing protein [Thermus antranikianii]